MADVSACIFDLDGVIVETNHYHFFAWKRLADHLGIPFTEKDNEQLKGVSRKGSLERILAMGNKKLEAQEFEDLMKLKNDWYLEYLEDMKPSDALPGVVPFISELRANGIKTALASSSKNAKRIISMLDLEDYFDALKDGTDVQRAKPDPQIFLLAADALNVNPENCVVFEDAIAGIEAARAAQMRTVGVGEVDVLSEANYVIPSFENFNFHLFKSIFDEIPTL